MNLLKFEQASIHLIHTPMNQIAGFLLFKTPNQYTKPSPASPSIHVIQIASSPSEITRDETFAIGTRCGTLQFHQDRVSEYLAFKRGQVSMRDLLFRNDTMLTLSEYTSNWRFYHNKQMKRWFGESLVDVY